MSIILDALKKLDRERAGRREGPPNIDTEILRPGPSLRRKKTSVYFATLFLTAVAATVVTYAVVKWLGLPSKPGSAVSTSTSVPEQTAKSVLPEVSSTSKPVSPAPKSASVPKPAVPVAPKASSPLKSSPPTSGGSSPSKQPVEPSPPEANPPPKSDPPVAPSQPVIPDPPPPGPARETKQEPSKTESPAEKKDSATPVGEKKEGQNVIPDKVDAAPGSKGKSAGPVPSGSAMSPLSLRITAIGWDEDPSKRFAFVNGMMVHEGDVIEEAKIVEIHPKHIRFLQNGQYFDVRM